MEVPERGSHSSVLTVCPYCSCGCGLYLEGAGERVLGAAPSEHHPVSGGRLCARGWAAHEASLWGPRIVEPMIRRDGRLEPASWEEALSAAADPLRRLVASALPVGVLGSGRASNEENFLAAALARAALRTGNVDAPLRSPYEHLLLGLGVPRGIPDHASALERLGESDLILLLEGELAATHPRAAFALLRALRRGGRLVTLGWAPTRMTRLAALHLPLPPRDPLQPLRELVDAVRGRGAPEAGDSRPVEQVASWLAASRRPALVLAPLQEDGALLESAASLLARAVEASGSGRGDSPGAGRTATLLPLPVRANSRGAREVGAAPHLLPGCRSLDDPGAGERLRRLWGGEFSREEGLPAEEMLQGVRGLVVVAEDPLLTAPSPARALETLEALDSLVVLDAFLTPTARAAQVVLPTAAFGEGAGTLTNLEGRVQAWRTLAPPPGKAREGWAVLRDLLEALGAPVSFRTHGEVLRAIREAVPEYGFVDPQAVADGWGASVPGTVQPGATEKEMAPGPLPGQEPDTGENGRMILRREGVFEWGDDPLVHLSPSLRRDHTSYRKLHPGGMVWMSPEEAGAMGIREGWKIRLRSSSGEVEVPASLRPGLGRGLLLVPFTFRGELAEVLGGRESVEVQVSRS